MTGRLITLVGCSSVGKSSAAKELQRRLSDPYLVVGIDHFFSMFPYEWAGHPRGPGPGFWYDETTDPDGAPIARIRRGEAGDRLLIGMRRCVNALLEVGNNVILDEMPLDEATVPAWQQEVHPADAFWVYLDAPLATLLQRERGRTRGQKLGNVQGHHGIGASARYDLRLDTDGLAPADVAQRIVTQCPFAR